MKPHWQTWLLGIVALLLVAWVGRAETKFDLVSRIEERLAAIQMQLGRIEGKLDGK
jgi:hypothetical protein